MIKIPQRQKKSSIFLFLLGFSLFIFTANISFGVAVETTGVPEFLTSKQRQPLEIYKETLEANEGQHTGYIEKLNGKYTNALDVAKARMVKIGATRAIMALDGEIARIKENDTRRSKDIEAAPDYVRKMRSQYDQFISRVHSLKRSRDGEALYAADRSLAELQLELTKSDELEKALTLRKFRQEFKNPPQPKEEPVPAEETVPVKEVDPGTEKNPPDIPDDPKANEEVFRPTPFEPPVPDPDSLAQTAYERGDDIVRPMTSEEMNLFTTQLGPPPARSGRAYSVMLASIQRREVTEITVGRIKSWGPARPQMWKGKPYWTATVTYPTTSLFGTFDTEGMAIISGNRVVEWRYTGSGEEIP